MPKQPLDNESKENIILDVVGIFLACDLDINEAQEISAAAIETLTVARVGLIDQVDTVELSLVYS